MNDHGLEQLVHCVVWGGLGVNGRFMVNSYLPTRTESTRTFSLVNSYFLATRTFSPLRSAEIF